MAEESRYEKSPEFKYPKMPQPPKGGFKPDLPAPKYPRMPQPPKKGFKPDLPKRKYPKMGPVSSRKAQGSVEKS